MQVCVCACVGSDGPGPPYHLAAPLPPLLQQEPPLIRPEPHSLPSCNRSPLSSDRSPTPSPLATRAPSHQTGAPLPLDCPLEMREGGRDGAAATQKPPEISDGTCMCRYVCVCRVRGSRSPLPSSCPPPSPPAGAPCHQTAPATIHPAER